MNKYAQKTKKVFGVWVIVLVLSFVIQVYPANAAGPLCGDGSTPDYGFTTDLQQAHWTVGWRGYVSQETVDEVDTILDPLNNDSIAQTMILILPQEQVGNRVNCAVHFLRYMKLGLPTGPRKDNGFVFLIVVEPNSIDVHYGVGLGLPALTAPELTDINRVAEDSYQSTHSLDTALLTLVRRFDEVARNKYTPLASSTTTPAEEPAGPLDIFTICLQLCFGVAILMILVWSARRGVRFGSFGSGPGFGGRGGGFGGFGGGRGGGGSSMRGGSGSGRSGRGN